MSDTNEIEKLLEIDPKKIVGETKAGQTTPMPNIPDLKVEIEILRTPGEEISDLTSNGIPPSTLAETTPVTHTEAAQAPEKILHRIVDPETPGIIALPPLFWRPDPIATQIEIDSRSSPNLRHLETMVSENKIPVFPIGPALEKTLKQLMPGERSDDYKNSAWKQYEEAVIKVKLLYSQIIARVINHKTPIRALVASFVDIFMKDKNLLMNLSQIPDYSDNYLYSSALNKCILSMSLATACGYGRSQVEEIAMGALLADIGMVLVPEVIRNKSGKLLDNEMNEIHKHPIVSFGILEKVRGISEIVNLIVWQHHERMNGEGYPKKRSGRLVHPFARIVGIADVFAALISKRAWRESFTPYKAMETVLRMGASGHLDTLQIRSFLKYMSLFPLGSLVQLKDGRIGKVVHSNPNDYMRPILTIFTHYNGGSLPSEEIYQVDLSEATDLSVAKALEYKALILHALDGF